MVRTTCDSPGALRLSWPRAEGPGPGARHANTLPGNRCGPPSVSPTDRFDGFCRADHHRPRSRNLGTAGCGPIVVFTVDFPVDYYEVVHSRRGVPSRRAPPPSGNRTRGRPGRRPPGPRAPSTARSTVGDDQHGGVRRRRHRRRRSVRPVGRPGGPSGLPGTARRGGHDPGRSGNREGRGLPTTANSRRPYGGGACHRRAICPSEAGRGVGATRPRPDGPAVRRAPSSGPAAPGCDRQFGTRRPAGLWPT